MPNIEHDRWKIALNRVTRIERTSKILTSRALPRKFTYAQRSAWATPSGLETLPMDQQHEMPGHGHIRARVRAESVLIGKFDVQSEVRLRAFYPEQGHSIRYQTGGRNNGILRTVEAYEQVSKFAPELMPTIYDHGSILKGRGAYLVEETVMGETATRAELEAITIPLAEQLHAVHEGVGVTDTTASKALGSRFPDRWAEFIELYELDQRIAQKVQTLLERDALLEVSLTHGDLVSSNILIDGTDFILVDWEWYSIKPIAFDMAKIIINVSDLEKFLQEVHTGLGGYLGTKTTHYSFREQVALALVQTLTFYMRQSVKARKANRTDALHRQTTKRVDALKKLLEVH